VIVLIVMAISFFVYTQFKKKNISVPFLTPQSILLRADASGKEKLTKKVTYVDTDFKLEIPANWRVQPSDRSLITVNFDDNKFDDRALKLYDPQKDKGALQLVILWEQSDKSFEAYMADRKSAYIHNIGSTNGWVESPATIDSQNAMQVKDTRIGSTEYYVKHPSKNIYYTIIFAFDFNNYGSIQNQFLSSLKFIN